MKAVILAGGLGERLRPFTQVIPKPLLPIGESSVLEIQIKSFKKIGFDEIYIATNYKSEMVEAYLTESKEWGVKLFFSRERKKLGTCGPVLLLKDQLTEPFILINGDILTTLDFTKCYEFAMNIDADLTVITRENITPFNFGKVNSEGDLITGVEEKPDFKVEILAGIYVLKPPVMDLIPADTYYGMDSLIKDMLANNMKVAKYLMREYWLDIGRIEDYSEAQDVYEEHFNHLKDVK